MLIFGKYTHNTKPILPKSVINLTIKYYFCTSILLMKRSSLILIFLLFQTILFAQQREFSGTRPDSLRRNAPKIGKIIGSLRDAKTNEPVSFAAVAFLSARDSSLVGGVQTNESGNFLAEDLPLGNIIIKASFIGYKTSFSRPISLSMQNVEVDAGVIKMSSSITNLDAVTITGEKADYVNSIDRKIYNMDKNIVNTGGTVTDVLQTIPSVAVDIDGNVALRGSANVTILIDGKPSGMLGGDRKAVLQQIPAGAIEQIEIITNPSAKFDADGMAGIINIKTKKEKMKGMNGNVTLGVGTNDKYNFGIGGNDRSPRVNLYANYNYRHESRSNKGLSTQYNFFPGQSPYYYSSSSQGTSKNDNHVGKLGADFFVNKFNTIGVSGSVSFRDDNRPEQIQYRFFTPEEITFDTYYRDNIESNNNFNYDLNADYRRTWDSTSREFTANLSYSSNLRESDNEYSSSLYSAFDLPYQINNNENTYQNINAQADLVQPINKTSKLEAGLKSSNRFLDNELNYSDLNFNSGLYERNNLNSDHFVYNEQIAAGYAMFTSKIKKLDYNFGLRAEQTFASIESQTILETYKNDYISFFPSAFFKYPLSSKSDLQLSYSRRVNRPDSRSLNPFVDYSDSLNIRQGNPFLRPEFTNALELSNSLNVKSWNITTSVFYRRTDDLISRYRTVDPNTGVGTMTTTNFSSSENTGGELIVRYSFEKLGSVMGSFNIYQSKINGTNVNSDYQTNSTQWSSRLNVSLRVAKNTSFQLTGNYLAPMTTVNGEIKGMSGIDVGLKQDLWNGKASLSLNVNDVFAMRKFEYINFGEYYRTEGSRSRESRVAMLNFSYKIGKADNSLFSKRKNQKTTPQESGPELIDY